ncbi:MAG: hypothetical protein M3R08_01950, partial [Bacteroidota bacterium]|nr:hypothetical protein [Bacteroidota bacterium]
MGIGKEKEYIFGDAKKDLRFWSEEQCSNASESLQKFQGSIVKLFDVDRWSDLPGISSVFELYDAKGRRKENSAAKNGDHIKIILPGIPLDNWVVVIDIQQEENFAEFTVRPTSDPTGRSDDPAKTKHF